MVMMADGSSSDAVVTSTPTELPEGSSSVKRCSACRLPVKNHPGSTGQLKCLVGRLNSLEERIIELESAVATRDETLAEQEALATKVRTHSLL